MTCENCIHYDLCNALEMNGLAKVHPKQCGFYTDKSRYVELPCKMGQTVYSIAEGITQTFVGEVYEITQRKNGIFFRFSRKGYYSGSAMADGFGKTVFLTKEEAEKALAERSAQ